MNPEDLKNSEELKSNVPSDPEQQEDAVDATGESVKKMEKAETKKKEKESLPSDQPQPPDPQKSPENKTVEALPLKEETIQNPENEAKDETSQKKSEPEEKEPTETENEKIAPKKVTKKEKTAELKETEKKKPKTEPEKPKTGETDYASFSQVELVNALRELLDKNQGEDIKKEVDAIKSCFYKLLKKENEEAKRKFVNEGGLEEEFTEEENPYEQDIKDQLKRYRQIRIAFNKKQEVVKEQNLELKYQVIEEIKNLINREESINKTFQDFRDLQARWREIGLVPQSRMKDLWNTYHFHVENFYDYIKINKELRDLDLKKNLEAKLKLCERAEELMLESSIVKAFNALQKLHERWREIGPVPRDKKDEIWERFKSATSKINKGHQEYFETRKSDQKKNLEAKIALCEKAEAIAESEMKNNKEWDAKSKEMVKLQRVWRTIGFAPKKDNNKIYERFRTACDTFFDNRREFYTQNKELQQNNLQMKIDLCVQAESLKESTDWKKTTQDFIHIQRKWKEIGPVPRKHSEQVWKRFRAACDYFFEMKSTHFSEIDEEQEKNLTLKENLIKEVKDYKVTKNVDKDLEALKEFQRRWTEIGHVPFKQKNEVLREFRYAINTHFDALKLDESKRDILKFRNKVSNETETTRGKNKIRHEREKYMSKLKQLENDLVLLDNNIGFFTQSKNAESLIEDVKQKIEKTKKNIELLKKKIRIIDEYDTE
jgi:hypothetical protein